MRDLGRDGPEATVDGLVALTLVQLGWAAVFLLGLAAIVTAGATVIDWLLDRRGRPHL
jgi:hypothetical protein